MSKAFDIKNKAQDELLAFANYELTNIIDRRIAAGEMDSLTPEDDAYYEVEIEDSVEVEVDVMDTYTMDIYTERREVESFVKYPGEDSVYVQVQGEEDPIALRALPFDSIVWLVDEMETMWNKIIKG